MITISFRNLWWIRHDTKNYSGMYMNTFTSSLEYRKFLKNLLMRFFVWKCKKMIKRYKNIRFKITRKMSFLKNALAPENVIAFNFRNLFWIRYSSKNFLEMYMNTFTSSLGYRKFLKKFLIRFLYQHMKNLTINISNWRAKMNLFQKSIKTRKHDLNESS